MFTTRIRPKISEKPLATMKRRPANVTASSRIRRNEPGSSVADLGRRLGDDEHVEDREENQRRRGQLW
jgi:hypothetical protein